MFLLHQLLGLQLWGVVQWLVVVLVQPIWTCVGRMDHVDPCRLWTCRTILQRCCSCRRMLVVWAWACVSVWCHLLGQLLLQLVETLPLLLFVGAWCVPGLWVLFSASSLVESLLLSSLSVLWVCVAAVAWRCPGEAELRYHVKMAASVESVAEAAHCRSNLLLNCAVVSGPVVQPKGPELSPVPTLVCWLSTMLHINMSVCIDR